MKFSKINIKGERKAREIVKFSLKMPKKVDKVKSSKTKIKCQDCKKDFMDMISHRKKKHPNLNLRCEFCVETNSCYQSELALKLHHR